MSASSVAPAASSAPAAGDVPGGIVLGLQGTVDYEVEWDRAVIEALVAEFGIGEAEIDADAEIVDERSLLVVLLGFLASGRGGERHAASSAIVERFAARLGRTVTLGGTCVRAALVLRRLGIPSLLHLVSTDENVRRLLPADCASISSATEDTLDPHLIVQFRPGDAARVGGRELVATEANRVIVANDPPAERLLLSAELGDRVARSRVFLVSGFNTIEDERILADRLSEVRRIVHGMAPEAIAVYEDAGFHRPEFAPRVAEALGPVVDVFGMNEDELQARVGRTVDLHDPEDVRDALTALRALVPDPTVLVHTRFWTALVGPRADELAAAADFAGATAAARYRHGDDLTADDVAALAAGPRQEASVWFARELEGMLGGAGRCLPAFDARTPAPTTIGLGDTFVGGLIAALAGGASS